MSGPCTLILHGGRVLTCDDRFSIAQAVAVSGDRILTTGTDAEVLAHRARDTAVIDLGGRTVMPGLVDGHAHMDREGLRDVLPSLAGARSVDDIVERIAALARATPPGEWIVTMPIGDPPDYENLPQILREGRFPDRLDLDRATRDHPVYIKPIWGYWRAPPLVSVANSRALALAGIGRHSVTPSESVEIQRGDDGEPTGIFIEQAQMSIVELSLMSPAPGFTHAQRVSGLRRSMAIYNSYGTTSVFEGHGVAPEVLAAYQELRNRSDASVRATLVFSPSWMRASGDARDLLRSWGTWLGRRGLGDSWLRVQGVFADIETDPLNSRLRASCHPRTGWSGFCYDTALPKDALIELLIEAARNGIRVAGIPKTLLDMYDRVNKVAPIGGQRWVLVHQSVLDAQDIARLKDLGVVVTTHLSRHIYKEGAALKRRLGADRQNDFVPLRRLLDAGIPFAFGSDNVPPTVWESVWGAVARRTREGDERLVPEQALSREEALRVATRGGAYLTFEEQQKGAILPGMLADLAVLDADPLTVPEPDLRRMRASTTIIGGKLAPAYSP